MVRVPTKSRRYIDRCYTPIGDCQELSKLDEAFVESGCDLTRIPESGSRRADHFPQPAWRFGWRQANAQSQLRAVRFQDAVWINAMILEFAARSFHNLFPTLVEQWRKNATDIRA